MSEYSQGGTVARKEFWIGSSISGWTAIESFKAYLVMCPNPETAIRAVEIKEGETILSKEDSEKLSELEAENDRLRNTLELIRKALEG